jgi:hypothetical protein
MAPFFRWLRSNAEHQLVAAAQARVAKRHGVPAPARQGGRAELFWRRIFVPAYRVLPWPARHAMMRAMPGSHRRDWVYPTDADGPAI